MGSGYYLVVSDDSVVDNDKLISITRPVRVAVKVGRSSMGCPPNVIAIQSSE